MRQFIAILTVIMGLSGCAGAASTPPAPAPAPAQTDGPLWVHESQGTVSRLIVPEKGGDVAVVTGGNSAGRLEFLSPEGKPVGETQEIPGLIVQASPDVSRFVVVSLRGRYLVMDRSGRVLWEYQDNINDKMGEELKLAPSGEHVLRIQAADIGTLRTTAFDLTGRELWDWEESEAGDPLVLSTEGVFLYNSAAVWFSSWTGAPEKVLIAERKEASTLEAAPDGSLILVGNTILTPDRQVLGTLPQGRVSEISQGGERILLETGKGAYTMVNRQGEPVWSTSLEGTLVTHALAPDGSHWLTATRDRATGVVNLRLFGPDGKSGWERKLELPAELRHESVEVALNPATNLAYVAVGNRIWAWDVGL